MYLYVYTMAFNREDDFFFRSQPKGGLLDPQPLVFPLIANPLMEFDADISPRNVGLT